jgi:dolichyl-phosphate beta-glucosyltransferase
MWFRTAALARLANTFAGNPSENGSYLGLPLLVILVAGTIALRRRPVMKVAALTTLAAFVLSLGSRLVVGRHAWRGVPLPEAALTRIPVLDNTIASRYALYVALGAAVMFALTLKALRTRLRARRPAPAAAGAACAALAALALTPLVPAWPYTARVTQVPGYFSSGPPLPGGSVALLYPFPADSDATAMLWQVAAGMRFKSPGGRFVVPAPGTAGTPPSSGLTLVGQTLVRLAAGQPPPLTPTLRSALRAQLRSWDVHAVLARPSGTAVSFFEWLLGRPPDATSGGISAWYGRIGAG